MLVIEEQDKIESDIQKYVGARVIPLKYGTPPTPLPPETMTIQHPKLEAIHQKS